MSSGVEGITNALPETTRGGPQGPRGGRELCSAGARDDMNNNALAVKGHCMAMEGDAPPRRGGAKERCR